MEEVRLLKTNVNEIDSFFKVLLFQLITDTPKMDMYEKTIFHYITRKTIHYRLDSKEHEKKPTKWSDFISMYKMKKDTGMSLAKVRSSIKSLEDKRIITVNRSLGGITKDKTRWNEFSISDGLVKIVYERWIGIKDDNNFTLDF